VDDKGSLDNCLLDVLLNLCVAKVRRELTYPKKFRTVKSCLKRDLDLLLSVLY